MQLFIKQVTLFFNICVCGYVPYVLSGLSFVFLSPLYIMETPTNIPCSQLVDALTELAHNAAPRKYNHVKTIPRQNTSYLTDTADAVREVAKKLGKH